MTLIFKSISPCRIPRRQLAVNHLVVEATIAPTWKNHPSRDHFFRLTCLSFPLIPPFRVNYFRFIGREVKR